MNLPRKGLAFAAVAMAAFTAAAPAMAQPGGYYDRSDRNEQQERRNHRGWNNGVAYGPDRARQAEARIEAGLRNGRLTSREAYRLRDDLRETVRVEMRLRRDGLSWRERQALDLRWDRLMAEIREESRDRQYGQGYGYGYRR